MLRRLAVLTILVLGVVLLTRGDDGAEARAQACPPGYAPLEADQGGEYAAPREDDGAAPRCLARKHPEGVAELRTVAASLSQRFGSTAPSGYARAVAARQRLSAQGPPPGGGGRWSPVGTGPLVANDPAYQDTFGGGFANLAGRITDFTADPAHGRVYASVGYGGVWRTDDEGGHWTSIGESLPTQIVGSVGYSPAGGGTLIALTGDNSFGGYSYGGVGAFRSTNGGRTWKKAKGVPDGAQGFNVAVDPTNPRVVYLATGLGLFRSRDAGVSYTNVALPTGPCAGRPRGKGCFLANIVTDVAVQAPDRFGHQGGAVTAVVGWRSGTKRNDDGSVQAPANGAYVSDSGRPGTFTGIDEQAVGFAPQANVGRVELGPATGADQNHGYLYALVQDAKLFNSGKLEGLDTGLSGDPLGLGIDLTATPTYLNGVYVSKDFGRTWKQIAGRLQFQDPTNGSTLAGLQALGFGPGIQSWYDQWIAPDPTRTGPRGAPARLELGLEELYENQLPIDGTLPTRFRTTGPYSANGPQCLLVLASALCATTQKLTPGNLTVHPDQHAGIWLPKPGDAATLLVGNDGGAYAQKLAKGQEVSRPGFGPGAQTGFNTLLPYGVDVANDGTVFAGLQDNGELRIDPRTGRQNEVFGGDGVFTQVDPKDSNIAYEETPNAAISVTRDSGRSWTPIAPAVDNASFYAPLVMDPLNARHVVTGGRQVAEEVVGPDITQSPLDSNTTDGTDQPTTEPKWARVFDLGTRLHPGVPRDGDLAKNDADNQISAQGVRGDAVYAGFCGACDPVKDGGVFARGIATNVGGAKPPKATTTNGWHIARAKGLPSRLVTSITIDPRSPRTIYVTLGSSSLRPFAPPNALGPDGLETRGGLLWKSTDAGRTFHDISGNLPRAAGTWTVLHRRQLVVGTAVGAFAARADDTPRSTKRLSFGVLGRGLPGAPVFSMEIKSDDADLLYVASYGRGIYRYRFGRARPAPRACSARTAISSTVGPDTLVTTRLLRLQGLAHDRGCRGKRGRVIRVLVTVARGAGRRCRFLTAANRFTPPRSCRRPVRLPAFRTYRWRYVRRVPVRRGERLRVTSRAVGTTGRETRATRTNTRTIRVR